jgi:hypothetical protein
MKSLIVRAFGVVACILLQTVTAHAQGWGVRGGANVNPDQMYVGASYQLEPLMQDLWLEPNGDAGFGNGAKLLSANLDLMHRLWQPARSPWRLDVGGGPAVNYYRFPTYSDTQAGVNVVAVLGHSSGWGTEFRVGFLDSPEFRVGVAYRLGQRAASPHRR